MSENMRVVRVPMAIELIRRMDRLLSEGVAGYETRAAFIAEAVDSMIVELSYEPAPPEPAHELDERPGATKHVDESSRPRPVAESVSGSKPTTDFSGAPEVRLEDTKLGHMPDCELTAGSAIVLDKVLFGLHNRDYPSLWIARKLADSTSEDLVPAREFVRDATESAWVFAERLVPLEKRIGKKLTALFPKNVKKRERALGGFREFAIGSWKKAGDELLASGPLFIWRMIQLENRNGQVYLGLTAEGAELLSSLSEISLDMPHYESQAEIFLEHLRNHAKADWHGFETILATCYSPVSRAELMKEFSDRNRDWGENLVATNTSGYIARAREWGLLEERTVNGQYQLTEFGSTYFGSIGGR